MALGVYSHSSPDLKAQAVPTPSAWGADDSPMAADQADRSDRKADPWLSKTDRRKERRRKLLSRTVDVCSSDDAELIRLRYLGIKRH